MIDERLRRIADRARADLQAAKVLGAAPAMTRHEDARTRLRGAGATPADPAVVIVRTPSLADQREEFLQLSEAEQEEEIRLHLAAVSQDSAIRPRFSDLLYAMGVIPPDA